MDLAATFDAAAALFPQSRFVRSFRQARTVRFKHVYLENEQDFSDKLLRFDLGEETLQLLDSSWKCWSEYGFVFGPDGSVVVNSFSFPDSAELVRYMTEAKKSAAPSRVKHLSGDVFVFTNVGSRNYFHVLTELIPRLELIEHFPDAKILVAPGQTAFGTELLKRTNFSDRTITLEPDTIYTADQLIAAPWGLNFIPERYNWLRQHFVTTERTRGRRIYIARRSGSRTIENEIAVERLFLDAGFAILETEGLSVSEQADLFSETAILAGPHGAGFANALWMGGGTVLEIRPHNWENRSLYHHALASGIQKYAVLHAPATGENMHMKVDLVRLKHVLDKISD